MDNIVSVESTSGLTAVSARTRGYIAAIWLLGKRLNLLTTSILHP